MRAHTLSLLKREKVDVTEEDLINWANEKVIECGNTHTIKNFKDKAAIKTALPIIDIINCIQPGAVNYTQVEDKPKMVFTTYAALKYTYDITITKTTTFQAK